MATRKEIKSGTYCKCGYCGYEGYAYGTPYFGTISGVSAPWCQRCGRNNKLEPLIEEK